MRAFLSLLLFTASSPCHHHPWFVGASSEEPKHVKPCTVTSPNSGSFYDLNGLAVQPVGTKKKHKDDREESWFARGHDYPFNITLNICAPVVEEIQDVVGVPPRLWKNVSGYYELEGKTYSIGQVQTAPIFRGRKLVLNYTHGSPCDDSSSSSASSSLLHSRGSRDDDDDGDEKDDDEDSERPRKDNPLDDGRRRKSTIISFLCEKDALDASKPSLSLSLVGTDPDMCSFFFEARSPVSCGGVSRDEEAVGPGGVFGLIVLIALVVYFLGGIAYQRTVMHQRGWRQVPNYSTWANVLSFCGDMIVAVFSSCLRLLPIPRRFRRGGYSQLPTQNGNQRTSRGNVRNNSSHEDENRLIDQLDEEWDD